MINNSFLSDKYTHARTLTHKRKCSKKRRKRTLSWRAIYEGAVIKVQALALFTHANVSTDCKILAPLSKTILQLYRFHCSTSDVLVSLLYLQMDFPVSPPLRETACGKTQRRINNIYLYINIDQNRENGQYLLPLSDRMHIRY